MKQLWRLLFGTTRRKKQQRKKNTRKMRKGMKGGACMRGG